LFTFVVSHVWIEQICSICRKIQPDLKVLFVTGYAENATYRSDFLDSGMDMLTKPFAIDALGAKVRAMIAGE